MKAVSRGEALLHIHDKYCEMMKLLWLVKKSITCEGEPIYKTVYNDYK